MAITPPKIVIVGNYAKLTPENPTFSSTNITANTIKSDSSLTVGTTTNSILSLITNNTPRVSLLGSGISSGTGGTAILTMNSTTLESISVSPTTISGLAATSFTTTVTTSLTYNVFKNTVNLSIGAFSGVKNGTALIFIIGAVPSTIRPTSDLSFIAQVMTAASTLTNGLITIRSATGNIEISANGGTSGTFTNGQTVGINSSKNITYFI